VSRWTAEGRRRRFPNARRPRPYRHRGEDVDRDGDVDRLLLVRVRDLRLECTVTALRLNGKTVSGQDIEGTAPVDMEGCP
jgi:hypothetical protein